MQSPLNLLCCSFLFLYPICFCILAESKTYQNNDSFLQCLKRENNDSDSIFNVIYTKKNSSYTPILESSIQSLRFGTPSQPKPAVIVTPLNYLHVQKVVKCARASGVKVRTRCGGHDYEGLSTVSYYPNPYVIVDMRNLNSVSADAKTRTAWVEGGALLGELYQKIEEESPNLAFPGGSCPTVGAGGLISGGGEGTLLRKYGIASDHIIDAKIVDANGNILDRKTMGEDLFWAIRGGGGASFGVILAYKVGLVYIPSKVTVFTINRTLEQNATKLVHLWQTVAPALDRNLFIELIITKRTVNKKPTVNVGFYTVFLGNTDDLLMIMQEGFPELGVKREDCREMTWVQSARLFCGLPIESSEDDFVRTTPFPLDYIKVKSDYVVEPIPESGLEGIWKRFMDERAERAQILVAPFGGRMSEVSESDVPFPHRAGNLYQFEYFVYWNESQNEKSQNYIDWIRDLYAYMTPFVSKSPRRAYLNCPDLDLGFNRQENATFSEGEKWGLSYFHNNFRRLARVKAASDPGNFFRFEISIPRF